MSDVEDNWDDLLAFIDEGRVIPIVGPELLVVDSEGSGITLYRRVAERLLERYGLQPSTVDLRPNQELNDAVCALGRAGKEVGDLYRPVADLIRAAALHVVDGDEGPLRQLAAVSGFDLFVSVTPDDLLARALAAHRSAAGGSVFEIEYAPNLPGDRMRDIPELRPRDFTAVLYLLGKVAASPLYAIHDEDTLEFLYTLQGGGTVPERFLAQLRERNLLLIGVTFPDWLIRFLLRLSNEHRLRSERSRKEFLAAQSATRDGSLTFFLERFSRSTRLFPGSAREFVAELSRRWKVRHPDGPPLPTAMPAAETVGGAGVFISYASQDMTAAQRLNDSLRAVGWDVIWFDKSALRPGDEWDGHIRAAVQRCFLFLPVISRTTEARSEGYFRLEWHEAAERSLRIQGRKFILPIVVDPDYDGSMARYQLVPNRFREFQFSYAPDGVPDAALRAELVEQVRMLRRAGQP